MKILAGLFLLLCSGAGIWWYIQQPFERILLTRPLSVLPPHAHGINQKKNDSLYDIGHGRRVESDIMEMQEDTWVTSLEVVTRGAPQSVLHHLVLFKLHSPNSQCPNRGYEELYTVGADSYPSIRFEPYGIFLPKGTKIYVSGVVHNPEPPRGSGETYKNVSIGYRMTMQRGSESMRKPLTFYRLFLDDIPYCKDMNPVTNIMPDSFVVPSNSKEYWKKSSGKEGDPSRLVFPKNGVVFFGGHLHPLDGGKELVVLLNDVLVATAIPHKSGLKPWEWSTTSLYKIYRVHKGDVLTIQARYENKTPYPITDAMGNLGLIFIPD